MLAIDPGLKTGVAVVRRLDAETRYEIRSWTASATVPCSSWEQEVVFLIESLRNLHDEGMFEGVSLVLVELPEFVKGEAVKLAFVAGRIVEFFATLDFDVRLVGVNEWKGQLSKERFAKRFSLRFPDFFKGKPVVESAKMFIPRSSHELDAAGIGLWALGVNWHGKQ